MAITIDDGERCFKRLIMCNSPDAPQQFFVLVPLLRRLAHAIISEIRLLVTSQMNLAVRGSPNPDFNLVMGIVRCDIK